MDYGVISLVARALAYKPQSMQWANNCSRIFPTTKRRPSYLLSTTGLYKPRSQVRPPSAHTINSVRQMCKTSTKPTLPHLQPPRVIETHSANSHKQLDGGKRTHLIQYSIVRIQDVPANLATRLAQDGSSHLISSRPLYRFPSAHLTNSSHHAREVSVLMSYHKGERHREKVARRIRTSRALNDSSR